MDRVTVSLPGEIVRSIDRLEKNRSRFILRAVRRELQRRGREELRRSLRAPHSETARWAAAGFDAWAEQLPPDAEGSLVDRHGGQAVRWLPGRGWTKVDE